MLRDIIELLNTLELDTDDHDIEFARGRYALPRDFKEMAIKIKQRNKWKSKEI